MDQITLSATSREVTGKAVKRLRKAGQIPVVVYGGPVDGSISLQVSGRELQRVLSIAGAARVINLNADGKRYPVLAREVQRHPTRLEITHVDFLAVRLDQPIQAEVRIVIVGDTTAIDENPDAVLMQITDRVTVEALPAQLPSQLEVDISHLSEVGQGITVADLPESAEYTIMAEPDTLLVSISAAMRAPIEDEEEEAEGAEAMELAGEAGEEAGEEAGDEETAGE